MELKRLTYLFSSLVTLVIFLITKDFSFYWDNVIQISVPANFYYDNNFQQLFLPNDIATGHPTFVGMYFAAIWKCFGKSLFVSHVAMMPFVFGLTYQIIQLIINIEIKQIWNIVGMLLIVLLDTTFLSQLSLITFEIIQLFFFIFCLNQLINNRKLRLAIGYILLMLVSLRGALIGFGILASYFFLSNQYIRFKIKNYKAFIPGLMALSGFLLIFYYSNGWIIHNTVSNNWDTANDMASTQTIFKNIGTIGWQLIDYGRIAIFGILLFILFRQVVNRKFEDEHLRFLFIIGLGQIIIIAPILIFSQIPFGHRYFLPTIIPMSLFVGHWMLNHCNHKFKYYFYTGLILILVSGHFWIYPKKISQGWDSTTLHWQYFEVAEQMNEYIISENVDPKTVGTFFPAYKSRRNTHLEPDSFSYSKYDSSQEYMLYSNAFNVEDAIIESIEEGKWEPIKSYESLGIEMNLYRRMK